MKLKLSDNNDFADEKWVKLTSTVNIQTQLNIQNKVIDE